MNAETRAKEIALAIRDAILTEANGKFEVPDGDLFLYCPDSNAMIDCAVIAAAVMPIVTRAENDKLEEAAREFENRDEPGGQRGVPDDLLMTEARRAAKIVRSLIGRNVE